MRGPYERLKYDLRRLWECPLCKRRERTPGTVTSRFCSCPQKPEAQKQEGQKLEAGQPVSMKLVADGPQRLVPVIARAKCPPSEPEVAVPTSLPAAGQDATE
jgi:hypothetical protein